MQSNFGFVFIAIAAISISFNKVNAQEDKSELKKYEFTIVKENPSTSVKNQYRSSTCWSFSSLAFLESELLRMGKGEYDLSEMFVVKHIYAEKAKQYVRFQGTLELWWRRSLS